MQKLGASRRQLLETLERGALIALPSAPFEICEWKKVRVNIDYHVEFDAHYYSVHYSHYINRHRDMQVRATATDVEVFFAGRRVAAHVRSYDPLRRFVTRPEHMPASHRAHLDWTPSRLIAWGRSVGENTATLVQTVMERRPHPEQGFKSALAVLKLRERYGPERLERACARAVRHQAFSYKSVLAILKNKLDGQPEDNDAVAGGQLALPLHENLRGSRYYH
jgi:transposase